MWRSIKPWISAVVLVLILHYSGALASISVITNKALINSGIMGADPDDTNLVKEKFDYNFSIQTLEGKSVEMKDFKGKTIFLNLWATWCGPCRAEMPSIQSLYEKMNSDSVAFIILSLDKSDQPEKVRKYIESKNFTFPVYMAGRLSNQTSVEVIPTTFVISPNGTLAYTGEGISDYDTNKFRKFIQKLNAETLPN